MKEKETNELEIRDLSYLGAIISQRQDVFYAWACRYGDWKGLFCDIYILCDPLSSPQNKFCERLWLLSNIRYYDWAKQRRAGEGEDTRTSVCISYSGFLQSSWGPWALQKIRKISGQNPKLSIKMSWSWQTVVRQPGLRFPTPGPLSGDFNVRSSITSLPEFFLVILHPFVWSTVNKYVSAARKASWFFDLTKKELKVESFLCEGMVIMFYYPCRDGKKFL